MSGPTLSPQSGRSRRWSCTKFMKIEQAEAAGTATDVPINARRGLQIPRLTRSQWIVTPGRNRTPLDFRSRTNELPREPGCPMHSHPNLWLTRELVP